MTRPRFLLLPVAAALLLLWRQRVALVQADTDICVVCDELNRVARELSTVQHAYTTLTRDLEASAPPMRESAADALLERLRAERDEELNEHGPNDWRKH